MLMRPGEPRRVSGTLHNGVESAAELRLMLHQDIIPAFIPN
jgi:hypothetical protein